MSHGIAITCGCGFQAEFERFCADAQGDQLPRAEYRCPSCRRHWRRAARGEWVMRHGQWTPERIEIEIIEETGS
jgi:hypothetical protein